ncbi:transient receptor potential cation channel subfamily A member 1-like isoform X7 [Bolinopsis microptera]|uniref:transient receptor potential cation channel subfamily A member 1-like isoform X7 n=1 Tax=Bolinopsis microptera TaxID=2820187 RepID=UPI003079BBAD
MSDLDLLGSRQTLNDSTYVHFLVTAAREGRVDAVKLYLKSAYYNKRHRGAIPPIDRLDSDEVGALHYAARYNHQAVMQLLVDFNANVNNPAQDDLTPLHYAARYTPKGTAEMETGLTEEIVPLPPTKKIDVIKCSINKKVQNVFKGKPKKTTSLSDGLLAATLTFDEEEEGEGEEDEIDDEKDVEEVEEDEELATEDTQATRLLSEILAEDFGSPPIQFLLDQGANVNAKDKYGLTALHCAADRGNYAAVVELLKHPSIIIECQDKQGETPLQLAVRANSMPCVRKLLSVGAKANCENFNQLSALHSACTESNLEILKMLCERLEAEGVKDLVNKTNDESMTPLHFAVEVGAEDVVNFLVDYGADVTLKRKNLDTPLHLAANHGFVEIARKLASKQSNIDLDAKNLERMTPLHSAARMDREKMMHLLIERGANLEALDKDGSTPLITAAGWGQMAAVKILLESGADVYAQDKRDKTAIFHAVEESRPKVLKLLLGRRGKQNLGNEIDKFQNTPLHLASQLGFLSCVRVLLEFGFCSDAQNEDDMCPLHLAALHGRIQCVKELVKWDPAIVNDEDEIANTPLHYAAQAGHVKTVIFLTEEAADVDAKNQFGWTPMDCAAACGMTKTLAALLDAGGEVDPIDKAKTTPLHLAAKNGHVDTVEFLLDNEANIRLTDVDGNNALELATMHTKKEVAETIIEHKKWFASMDNRHPNGDTPMKKLIRMMPDVAMQVFNKCTDDSCNPEHMTNDHKEYQVEFDYRYLDEIEEDDESAEFEDSKSLMSDTTILPDQHITHDQMKPHPLQVMVKAKRIELLDHPLVQSLIYNKWECYGKWFYYFNLTVYLIYLASLTIFALNQKPPYNAANPDNMTKLKNVLDCDDSEKERESNGEINCVTLKFHKQWLIQIFGFIVLGTSAIRLLLELAQFIVQKIKYFSVMNVIEIILFVSSFYFCHTVIFGLRIIESEAQWQIGVFSVFIAWMNLIMFLRKFPKIGIYIVMFVTVLLTFLQIMIILLIFIVAFALSFNMVLDKFDAFTEVLPSIMKTFVMMTGELEYDGYYVDVPLYYPEASYALFICFVIVVPIVFMNLLVGLAVDDIKEVQHRAGLERSVMKIELIFQVENLLPQFYLRKINLKKAKYFVNQGRKFLGGLCCGITIKDIPFNGETINEALHPNKTGVDELKSTTESLEKSVRRMRVQVDQLTQQNGHIIRMLHVLSAGTSSTASDDINVDQDLYTEIGSRPMTSKSLDTTAQTLVAEHKVFDRWNRQSQTHH